MTEISLDRLAQAFGMDAAREADSHQYATVQAVNDDGSFQVRMNGALSTARAACLCNAEAGDRVLCVIHNGQLAAIARVGGVEVPSLPEKATGTITKVYAQNGFTLEADTFYSWGEVVTVPIQFSSTTAFAGDGATEMARIPQEFAPAASLRFPIFTADWSNKPSGYLTVGPTGAISFISNSCSAWFGVATYIRG